MASLNTSTMNFSIIDRKTGKIFIDYVFENTFTMLQDFGKAMEESGVKPEIEVYDMGGQAFRAESFVALMNALPPRANFTACGVGTDEFPCIMQSCLLGGHMRVGLEDNIRMPDGELAKGSLELVEVAVKVAECMGRPVAASDEARQIMGLKGVKQ